MRIQMETGGHTLTITLADNPAARAFWQKLPLTLPMMNLYGWELRCRCGAGTLPAEGIPQSLCHAGDLCYWSPAGSISFFYKDSDGCKQERIGHTDEGLHFLQDTCDMDVTFTPLQEAEKS